MRQRKQHPADQGSTPVPPEWIATLSDAQRRTISEFEDYVRSSQTGLEALAVNSRRGWDHERNIEIGKRLQRHINIRDGVIPPPWLERMLRPPKEKPAKDERQVSRAKTLMFITYPDGEWRKMTVVAVRKGCEPAWKAGKAGDGPFPSRDAFARGMGRRRQ
jgi:hypothetical protein